jgi:hypothetical protein
MIFTQENEEKFPTLFGFKTDNKVAANLLNIVYGIVMVVSISFAYYALSLILVGWSFLMIFLASLAVVGLPYCIKIILFGRKEFTLNMAVLCIVISILPTIFDFIGFYAKTSVRQSLIETKFEVLEKINYFDKEARESITQNIIQLDQNFNDQLIQTDKKFNEQKGELNKQVLDAEQTYIDETEGIAGKTTSGKIGAGPKARELEAEWRRKEAENELALETLKSNKDREIEKINKNYLTEKSSLEEGIAVINQLTKTDKDSGVILEVTKAQTFDELAETLIRLNSSINIISSKLQLEPEYIKFSTENIIQLSFGALFRGDITAIICLSLAVLLEIIDIIIVYMMKNSKKKVVTYDEEKTNSLKERIYYTWDKKDDLINKMNVDKEPKKENFQKTESIWIYNK